jgi:hypothetical protein
VFESRLTELASTVEGIAAFVAELRADRELMVEREVVRQKFGSRFVK